ncbi:hypothetical protein ASE61_15205 [Bosea sp. Root670]|uniref:hypothetical protein n=1 Tax=Bosea sp. Root670 TaxID=1736583 RepID=UPI000712C453|nr:hypothetical protein [Bosea sp. Root670]KRE02623.1 hypothetical protein ASE61_15205 [Bosea sp. Root670]
MAYQGSTVDGGMSVDLEPSIIEAGTDPREHVTSPKWIASVRFTVEQLRSLELQVGFDPQADNPHHGQAWGAFPGGKRKRLAAAAAWFVPLDDVDLI